MLALAGATLSLATQPEAAHAAETIRVATFNLALFGRAPGEILARLQTRNDPQACRLAEIIQRVRPDVLVLNEIDYDPQGAALAAFCDNYLAAPQHASQSPAGPALPISFPH
ncbi:MAG TPA: endonuclease/exonuclease/phosphatase family protein, partial [Lacipirellulaceae bacterium]|nr:endonuclease/exonuclease/phosphatase family protein [Lacipirellulaceae bacterium]